MKVTEIMKYVIDPNYRFLIDANRGKYDTMDDKTYIERKYKAKFGKKLDLRNPQTFNEKLQWLKLYDRKPVYTEMVDKYEVKKYVARNIGEEYLIPSYGVWDHFNEINFDSLPNQFVLKCTHDSGGIYIVKDKSNFNYSEAQVSIENRLQHSYYLTGREWPYKNVRPRIIAEHFMEDTERNSHEGLRDYKVHCFNGVPKVILVCQDRFAESGMTEDFFDTNWNRLDAQRKKHRNSAEPIHKPIELDKMLKLAEELSTDIPFIRVDFYVIHGRIYFGELTFFPASGFEEFIPEAFDLAMGKWIDIRGRSN